MIKEFKTFFLSVEWPLFDHLRFLKINSLMAEIIKKQFPKTKFL